MPGRQDSASNGMPSSYYGSGARQIPGRAERSRRESAAGSFANGMSWGGVSVGSWVRDEYASTPVPAASDCLYQLSRTNNH